jgi:signal transduction histidine kinase
MQRLVDSLLSVSRMESGETQFVMGEVDIGHLIEEVVRSTSILDRKSVVIQTHIAPGLPSAVADREVIERVLFNLMDNALKYTPDHGQITWSAEKRDQTIQVSITDTGPGIPPQDAEYIFERFAQASGEKPRRRGFGLGLAYCKLAVERHDGRIWVEPGENGQGSRFILTLPAMTA